MPFIFLSYSHKDGEYANRLADSLEAQGLDVWIDERIDYGAAWPRAIQENLDRCSAFVVLMTPDAFESEWVQAELARARRKRKPTFALLLEGEVWLALETTQYVDVRGGKLPPPRFYRGLAGVLAQGGAAAVPSAGRRERLAAELSEQQALYTNLTRRIAAVITDLGREPDGERRLMLEERRAELSARREEMNVRLAQIERALAEEPAAAAVAPARPAVDAAVLEAKPNLAAAPLVQPVEKTPSPPARKASPDLLVVDQPIGLELVRVPAGEFLMGSDPAKDELASDDERPPRWLSLPEYFIGKYPVTNGQYAVFVQQTKGKAPNHWQGGKIPSGKEQHPVVKVSWHDVRAFCRWLSEATGRGFRLPNEAEWEKAARGVDGRLHPWGDQAPSAELCNFGMNVGDTTPVDRYPGGTSPCGALDMAGNVWEWTGSLFKPYPYDAADGREDQDSSDLRVVRGGSFRFNDWRVRCASRYHDYPNDRAVDIGFRLVLLSSAS